MIDLIHPMIRIPGISGIKGKMMLMMVMIAIIPLIATAMYTSAQIEEKIADEALAKLSSNAVSRASDVDHVMQLSVEKAKIISGLSSIRHLDSSGINDSELIERIQTEIESIQHESHQLSNSNNNIEAQTDTHVISVWDIHGNTIASTEESLIGKLTSIELLEQTKAKGTHFGGIEIDPLFDQPELIFTQAIHNWDTDEFAGVVFLEVDATTINNILLNRDGLGETGELYLVNNEFMMVSESRFIEDAAFNVEAKSDVIADCLDGTIFSGIYPDYRDVPILGTQIYLQDQDWCLLSEVDVAEAYSSAYALNNTLTVIVVVTAIVIGTVSVFASRGIVRTIMKPVVRVSQISKKISQGDLTENIERSNSKDELGVLTNSIHDMIKNLREIVGKLKNSSQSLSSNSQQLASSGEQIKTASGQVATSVDQIARGTQDQAQSIQNIQTSVGSIKTSTDELVQNADDTYHSSQETLSLVKESSSSANDAKSRMNAIIKTTQNSVDQVKSLAQKTTEINTVLDTIQAIAAQTNLLSLNASIEAARAGDAGRGFAVVADEVRRLAQDCVSASKDIGDKLLQIKDQANAVVVEIESGVEEVQEGKIVIDSALEQISQITEKTEKVSVTIQGLSNSAKDQIDKINQVVDDTNNIAAVSEENAASTEETSAATEEQASQVSEVSESAVQLQELARDLTLITEQFNINSSGSSQSIETNNETNTTVQEVNEKTASIKSKLMPKISKTFSRQ